MGNTKRKPRAPAKGNQWQQALDALTQETERIDALMEQVASLPPGKPGSPEWLSLMLKAARRRVQQCIGALTKRVALEEEK